MSLWSRLRSNDYSSTGPRGGTPPSYPPLRDSYRGDGCRWPTHRSRINHPSDPSTYSPGWTASLKGDPVLCHLFSYQPHHPELHFASTPRSGHLMDRGELTCWSPWTLPHEHSLTPMSGHPSPSSSWSTAIPHKYIKAIQTPHHHHWDCVIELLPNTVLPRSKVYPLSLSESQAMEEYIEKALAAGFIRPSTTPVEKKDRL